MTGKATRRCRRGKQMGKLGLVVSMGLAVSALGPRVASADEVTVADKIPKPANPKARELLKEGITQFRLHKLDDAVKSFETGMGIEENPLFFYNLGQCARAQGRNADAIFYYRRFLGHVELPASDPLSVRIEGFIKEMEKGTKLEPAEPLSGDENEPPSKRAAAKPQAPSAPPSSAQATPVAPVVQLHPPHHHESWYRDWSGWTLAGAGAASGAVGIALLVNASNLDDQATREPIQDKSKTLHERASTRRIVGGVLGGAGVGLLIAGAVKLAITSNGEDDRTAWHVGVSGQTVFVFGSF
jgi:hypothetical protein